MVVIGRICKGGEDGEGGGRWVVWGVGSMEVIETERRRQGKWLRFY